MSFICIRIENRFQVNGFGLSLALNQRIKTKLFWMDDKNYFIIYVNKHSLLALACISERWQKQQILLKMYSRR